MRPGSGERGGPHFSHVVITCEHGGNRVPPAYRALFKDKQQMLGSHRGWDPGALELAGRMATFLSAPLISATTTRLLVDLNRSLSNPSLFSHLASALPDADRARVLTEHYHPYRTDVERAVRSAPRGAVLHISVHSFTPVLRGTRRRADIGLLFDPARELEGRFCRAWRRELARGPGRRPVVRMNYPYKGTDDGLTTHLRGILSPSRYAGIELEVNQRFPRRGGPPWGRLQQQVIDSLARAIGRP